MMNIKIIRKEIFKIAKFEFNLTANNPSKFVNTWLFTNFSGLFVFGNGKMCTIFFIDSCPVANWIRIVE